MWTNILALSLIFVVVLFIIVPLLWYGIKTFSMPSAPLPDGLPVPPEDQLMYFEFEYDDDSNS